jgi:hypothetical protein
MVSAFHTSFIIAIMTLTIFISGLSADLVSAQSSAPEPMVIFTPEEKAWLRENPHIRLTAETTHPPFSMVDVNGKHTGILADVLEHLSNAIGQKIEVELIKDTDLVSHEIPTVSTATLHY